MPKAGAARYIPVMVDFIAQITGGAVLVGYEGRDLWVPKSVIWVDDIPEQRSTEPAEINIQDWWAKQAGINQ